ncbi:MAG TPA: hypothetical protein VMW05_12120 [Methyloceanibacter sp.]|jgi:hypothetical protein|nr:hypothetical protein [Methyloceanibacter sp.]
MVSTYRRDFDPLDLEIVERAFHGVLDAVSTEAPFDLYSDEALEAALRRELVEMVSSSGVSDPEALLHNLVADLSDKYSSGPQVPAAEGHAPVPCQEEL